MPNLLPVQSIPFYHCGLGNLSTKPWEGKWWNQQVKNTRKKLIKSDHLDFVSAYKTVKYLILNKVVKDQN